MSAKKAIFNHFLWHQSGFLRILNKKIKHDSVHYLGSIPTYYMHTFVLTVQEYMTEDMETEQILVTFGQRQVKGSFLQDCLCQSVKIEITEKNFEIFH